jgi:hypothetical protein
MKCPHCQTGIHEQFARGVLCDCPQITESSGAIIAHRTVWSFLHMRCPECFAAIIRLEESIPWPGVVRLRPAYPIAPARPVPLEVTDPYKQDFSEACLVLPYSPKASAALTRRCLQAILRDKTPTKSKDLFDQIEEVSQPGILPSHIVEDLHAVRTIGNIGAHSLKSTNTGEILDVAPGEAEWNLDVVESLFDFYFVQPALSAKRKAVLNEKLKDAGKATLK